MTFVVKDRVKVETTTTGTGTLTLGAAATGYQDFSVIGDGNTTYYAIQDVLTGDFEVGIGTYDLTGDTLTRDEVLSSSNSDALVDLPAGTKDVFVTYPAGRSVFVAGSGVTSDTGAVYINKTLVTEDTVINTGENGFAIGPLSVDTGASLTVVSGQRLVVL